MPGHIADHYNEGGRLPGVLLIKHGSSLGQIVEALYLICFASDSDEYHDSIQFIP